MSLLEVRGVSKSFGAIRALTDVSFTVESGEVVGLMGYNGAGKSKIVKLFAGNFPPNDGKVLVDDQVYESPRGRNPRAIGDGYGDFDFWQMSAMARPPLRS